MRAILVRITAALAAAALPTQAFAAQIGPGAAGLRHGIGGGAYISVPLGRTQAVSPRAGLRLSVQTDRPDVHAIQGGMRARADIFDLGVTHGARPTLRFAGQDAGTLGDRLNADGGVPTAVYVVGGVVLALGVGFLVLRQELSEGD